MDVIKYWKWTFLLIAAMYLLPPWVVGCGALGAALGIWFMEKRQGSKASQPTEATPKEHDHASNVGDDNQPSNIIQMKDHKKGKA